MNKILLYLLGVYCSVSCNLCLAAEKFDMLPDLPNSVSPVEASTVSH